MDEHDLSRWIIGSCAALGSAFFWALGSILMQKLSLKTSPLGLNFFKSFFGTAFLLGALFFFKFTPLSLSAFILLATSGILGITLGDTFFFKALVSLGPRLTLLLSTFEPIFTVIIAVVFLKERLSLPAVTGIFLTLAGVKWVLWEQTGEEHFKKRLLQGTLYSLIACLGMSIGIILTKIGVKETSALQATFIRMASSFFFLLAMGTISKKLKTWIRPFKDPHLIRLGVLSLGVVVFGGFWLFTVSLKYIHASVATVLNSTTPLFILPMVVIISKEKISLRAILGAVIAVVGVALIILS